MATTLKEQNTAMGEKNMEDHLKILSFYGLPVFI